MNGREWEAGEGGDEGGNAPLGGISPVGFRSADGAVSRQEIITCCVPVVRVPLSLQ